MWPLESGCKLKKLSNPSLFFLYDFVALYISYLIWEGAHVIGLLNKKLRFIILLEPNLKKKKEKNCGRETLKEKDIIVLCLFAFMILLISLTVFFIHEKMTYHLVH